MAQGPQASLSADFQDVGPATSCPSEPASVTSIGEGFAVTGTVVLTINSEAVTVWFTSDGDAGDERIDTDVVVGTSCVDVGGAEDGVASRANRLTLEQIMSSVQPTP
jgi:hypothetical protein